MHIEALNNPCSPTPSSPSLVFLGASIWIIIALFVSTGCGSVNVEIEPGEHQAEHNANDVGTEDVTASEPDADTSPNTPVQRDDVAIDTPNDVVDERPDARGEDASDQTPDTPTDAPTLDDVGDETSADVVTDTPGTPDTSSGPCDQPAAPIGSACGLCGTWVCDADSSPEGRCEDPGLNPCGACGGDCGCSEHCAEGSVCIGTACVEVECEPGEKRCSSDYAHLELCVLTDDGAEWRFERDCSIVDGCNDLIDEPRCECLSTGRNAGESECWRGSLLTYYTPWPDERPGCVAIEEESCFRCVNSGRLGMQTDYCAGPCNASDGCTGEGRRECNSENEGRICKYFEPGDFTPHGESYCFAWEPLEALGSPCETCGVWVCDDEAPGGRRCDQPEVCP